MYPWTCYKSLIVGHGKSIHWHIKCPQGMLKVYVDMLNVTHDMVQLSVCMVNVSQDMIQVFMDMEHVSYGMLNVPHVKLKYIWP
jgi:hypothetical protein